MAIVKRDKMGRILPGGVAPPSGEQQVTQQQQPQPVQQQPVHQVRQDRFQEFVQHELNGIYDIEEEQLMSVPTAIAKLLSMVDEINKKVS